MPKDIWLDEKKNIKKNCFFFKNCLRSNLKCSYNQKVLLFENFKEFLLMTLPLEFSKGKLN